MASLESLPADQRAVLQLVLQRGRSYDQIAELLSIDRAAVRQRALQALDALGPQTRVPPERRALITDYLLGQLPSRVAQDTRTRLAESASERAWARVIASELTPLASKPLPEIPVEGPREESLGAPAERTAAPSAAREREPEPAAAARAARERPLQPLADGATQPSSRRGGAILLGLLALVIVAAVIVVIATSGGSSKHSSSSVAASTPTSTAATTSATTTSTTSSPQIIGQVNLTSPTSGSAAGAAFVLKSGTARGILIRAQHVPPNTKHDAYAVWLFNSPSDSKILGFVSPGVGKNGQLETAGALPSNASRYKQLLVTRETVRRPTQPGTIILQGALTGLS